MSATTVCRDCDACGPNAECHLHSNQNRTWRWVKVRGPACRKRSGEVVQNRDAVVDELPGDGQRALRPDAGEVLSVDEGAL